MRRAIGIFAAVLVVLCGTASAASVNLVTNGSFEQGAFGIGSFQGWQTDLGDISTFVDSSGQTGLAYGQASDGLWAAYFGSTAADGGSSIRQTLDTAVDQTYVLSFDLANDNGGLAPINRFLVSVDDTAFSFTDAVDQNFIHYQLLFVAGSDATKLEFSGSNDNVYIELDDVVVSPVPEPATSGLILVSAVGGLAMALLYAKSKV